MNWFLSTFEEVFPERCDGGPDCMLLSGPPPRSDCGPRPRVRLLEVFAASPCPNPGDENDSEGPCLISPDLDSALLISKKAASTFGRGSVLTIPFFCFVFVTDGG